jgi:hypothetical protein
MSVKVHRPTIEQPMVIADTAVLIERYAVILFKIIEWQIDIAYVVLMDHSSQLNDIFPIRKLFE